MSKKPYTMSAEARAKKRAWNAAWAKRNIEKVRISRKKWSDKNPQTEARRIRKNELAREHYIASREMVNAKNRAWRIANPDKVRAARRRYVLGHPEKANAWYRNWRRNNPDRVRQKQHKWASANPDKTRAGRMRHLARKKSQTHPDHDADIERLHYAEAVRIQRGTGVAQAVDHIIPISRGGWHHHLNLQVMPAALNGSKNDDPFWEYVGYKSWRDVPEYLWPETLAPLYRARKAVAA